MLVLSQCTVYRIVITLFYVFYSFNQLNRNYVREGNLKYKLCLQRFPLTMQREVIYILPFQMVHYHFIQYTCLTLLNYYCLHLYAHKDLSKVTL